MNRAVTAIGTLAVIVLAASLFDGLVEWLFRVGLVLFGALLAAFAMSVKAHRSIAYPDFPSEFVPADRAPDTEDVTQAEAEDAEAAA